MSLTPLYFDAADYEDKKRMFSWWVQYLLRSEAYLALCATEQRPGTGPAGRTFSDFGDVREIDFETWWLSRGFRLAYKHPVPILFTGTTPPELKSVEDSGDYQVVALPLDQNLAQRKKIMEKLEDERLLKIIGRETPFGHYRVHSRPDEILQKWLMIWDSKQNEPTASLIDIAKQLDLGPVKGIMNDDKAKQKIVSRNLITARRVIDNAAEGIFAEY